MITGSPLGAQQLDVRQRARAASDLIASRLQAPRSTAGHAQSLAAGAAGIALMYIERAAASGDTAAAEWHAVHHWLTAATADGADISGNASLFHGAPAIAFALHCADLPGYTAARTVLNGGVAALTRRRLRSACRRLDSGQRPNIGEYDLIRGLTGLGAHLWRTDPASSLIPAVLAYLVRLTEPVRGLPGWWTPAPPGRTAAFPPGGHSNHGLAHGIAGPLAFLSHTARAGLTADGQAEAIRRICSWLDAWQQTRHGRPWWPESISLPDMRCGHPTQQQPLRPSWCYGTPGIARSVQLAAFATGDPHRQAAAEAAIAGCLSDPGQLALITDRGLCHGTSGLYIAVASIAADAASPLPDTAAALLLSQPAPAAEPPGFLTGTAGHALALHALATGNPPATAWDAALLLR
jgi:hypothetical protein